MIYYWSFIIYLIRSVGTVSARSLFVLFLCLHMYVLSHLVDAKTESLKLTKLKVRLILVLNSLSTT
jgi:hypothetical protein